MRAFKNKEISVLISSSADGQLAAEICDKWHYTVFRGSSSKNAVKGLRGLLRQLSNPDGNQLGGMALDGPRGPYHLVQSGSQWMVHYLNFPVYPIFAKACRGFRLKSWDRCLIPLPFTRVQIHIGRPAFPTSVHDLQTLMEKTEVAAYNNVNLG